MKTRVSLGRDPSDPQTLRLLKENGQEVYADYDNHGSDTEPVFVTYDYYIRQ